MFNRRSIAWGFALAGFALLPVWALANTDSQSTCCAKHAYCCTIHAQCCGNAGEAATAPAAVSSEVAAKPTCCDKHAYCCTTKSACCGKDATLVTTP